MPCARGAKTGAPLFPILLISKVLVLKAIPGWLQVSNSQVELKQLS